MMTEKAKKSWELGILLKTIKHLKTETIQHSVSVGKDLIRGKLHQCKEKLIIITFCLTFGNFNWLSPSGDSRSPFSSFDP